jgi:hypothetical protein
MDSLRRTEIVENDQSLIQKFDVPVLEQPRGKESKFIIGNEM